MDSENRVQQIALVHGNLGAYAIIWRNGGYQRTYPNLRKNAIERISRLVDKLMAKKCFRLYTVGTGEVGWIAIRFSV